MLKIRALNRESSSDEDVPIIRREAQEEIALELYNNALRLQTEGKYSESESILSKIIKENIPLLENNGGLPKSMSTLKYSCHINIGNVFIKQNRVSEALQKYLEASDLDGTDVSLWYKIGKLSLTANQFHQSAYAFSKGLDCSESHWPCLDNLISILYATRDIIGCLEYIGKALILDPDYIKGLVLRKQIYLDNPAAKEYYQLYNPDYIWEPSLDVDIDPDEEKAFLEEAQALCERVTKVEKSFEPKPLQTIPLPKPLDEQTWISLVETVTYLHQYITDNEMSHFTMIDMSKCMSQSSEVIDEKPPIEEMETEYKSDDIDIDGKTTEQINSGNVEQNMEVETVIERRFSVNSETNTDALENTPVQTDNDEEQNTEQDNEEPDDNSENKSEKVKVRASKRKRDLLSDLQIWGWHSKRKPPKKVKDRDFTIEDALNRIVPKTLLKNKIDTEKFTIADDSMNTMDLYNLYIEDNNVNYLSPIHSPKSVNYEPYFNTDREKDDVLVFWTKKRDRCDAVVLIKELVYQLSKLWHYKWPKVLVPLYITAYNMFREHCDPPQLFCGDWTFEAIRDDALATILYGELLSFSSEGKDTQHLITTALGYLQLISGWDEQWKDEYPSFFNRVYWLRSYIFRKENNNDLAARCLDLIQEVIQEEEAKTKEKYMLSLPNCFKYGLITSQITEKVLKHLELLNSLSTVENLFNSEKYVEVANIIKRTFSGSSSHPQVGRLGRPAQLGMLMHSLWFTDSMECFLWTEECLYEALEHFLKPKKDLEKWERMVEKCLAFLYEIIKKESVTVIDVLSDDKKSRLVESLAKIISKQLNTENVLRILLECVTPWILMHYILLREEQRQYAIKRAQQGKNEPSLEDVTLEAELYPSVAILFSAHEFLGPKGWCLTNQGELLHFILDTVLDRLDTPIFESFKDKIDIHLEQAFFCLYQHPSKKNKVSRHLADHNIDPLPLVWERALQLYEFFGPDHLPEFNSYKNASISAELEQLLKRIIALVPSEIAPHSHLPKILDFINGRIDKLPEPIEFPRKVQAIYYLIADFYFKQKDFAKCIKYFQLDLCINPQRMDSWACLGLSYAAQLDAKLNHCVKFKSDTEFLDKAKCATICFHQALEISPDHLILWIEFGTFQYTVHSYCSRILKYESENLSMEKFEYLENQKNHYLDSSGNSFEKAIGLYEIEETNEPDERWLQYYILGKIAEKKQREPSEYLQYYLTANTLLKENSAEYPEKINYTNPQHLSVEALELHYRIHASVLKYLELHEGKDISNTLGAFFNKCLNSSNCIKKAIAVPQKTPVASTVETSPKTTTDPTSNALGYQDQFLNAIKTNENIVEVTEEGNDVVMEDMQGSSNKDVPESDTEKTLEKLNPNETGVCEKEDIQVIAIDDDDKDRSPKTNAEITTDVIEEKQQEMEQDDDVTIVEQVENVITIIDSDEEDNKQSITTPTKDIDEKKETVTVSVEEPKQDVQKLLDEMMVETMKGSEQNPPEVDSDMSGTDNKIEEVTLKVDRSIKAATNSAETQSDKEKKICDNETNNENNKKNSNDSSTTSSSSSSSSSSSESDSDDESSSSSSSSSSENNENMSTNDISQLIDKCVSGLEICIIRLCQNYKALYRLAHLYFNYQTKKDIAKSKQLLLGEYKCKNGNSVAGLFSDRKANNFFNGIWRIPSSEIDRPGSLSAHMSRCISLVLQILRASNDNKTLIDLAIQLRKTPEPDKIYIKDAERAAFSDQALTMCCQCLRAQMKNIQNMSNTQKSKLLQEIYKVYQRVQKHIPGKETTFGTILVDIYKNFIKEKIPDNANVLELATKFCVQNKQVEKQKSTNVNNNNPVPLPRVPGVTAPPVLPSPATVATATAAAQPIIPPKKLSVGRPRGRPPKAPGQVRQPRAKTSSSSSGMSKAYNWQKSLYDQTYAYEYLKHYQDELIKQYSQTLSIGQLAQLSQVLNQGQQLSNPLAAAAAANVTNPYLNPSGLLNPSSLVKQISAANTGLGMLQSNQFMDSLKQLSPSLKKKLVADQAMAMNADQKKFFDGMLPSAPLKSSGKSNSASLSSASSPGKSSKVHNKQISASISKPPSAVEQPNKIKPIHHSTSTSSSSNLFKEMTKASSSNFDVPKVPKEITKDRPNLSITPVNLPPPTTASPTFVRPVTTSPSSGKTLQEKLAEKKKEQLNKQMKSSLESELRADAIMKGMTMPTIPSSLSLSKTNLSISTTTFLGSHNTQQQLHHSTIAKPTPSISPISPHPMASSMSKSNPGLSTTQVTASNYPKYSMDFGHSLTTLSPSAPSKKMKIPPIPASVTFSKTSVPGSSGGSGIPSPQFSLDSGITISQMPYVKSKHKPDAFTSPKKATTSNLLQKLNAAGSIEISPVKSKQATDSTRGKHLPNFKAKAKKRVDYHGIDIIANEVKTKEKNIKKPKEVTFRKSDPILVSQKQTNIDETIRKKRHSSDDDVICLD